MTALMLALSGVYEEHLVAKDDGEQLRPDVIETIAPFTRADFVDRAPEANVIPTYRTLPEPPSVGSSKSLSGDTISSACAF
jgi:hypothetical protein